MVKEKRILSFILGWFIVGFIIIFMGVNNVFAATYYLNYEYRQQYYNNHGSYLETINTTWNESLQSYISGNIPTTANSYGAGLSISTPIPIITNHTYTISFYFEDISNIALSSKKNIAIGMSLSSASGNYASNNFWAETLQSSVKNNSIIQYVFKANGGADYIFIPWTTTTSTSQSYVVTQIIMEDLGSEGLSQEQINTSLNNQTNTLNNSIQNSTDTITGEIDDMEQNIIDSNKETQEVIKDQFNNCRPSVNLFSFNNYTEPQADASLEIIDSNKGIVKIITESKYRFVYVFINGLEKNTNYTFSGKFINSNPNMKDLWFSISNNPTTYTLYNNSYSSGSSVTFNTGNDTAFIIYLYGSGATAGPNEATWYDIQLEKGDKSTPFEPYGEEICSNKIDETNNKLNGIQGALTDSSAPNTSGLENSAGWLPAGPLDIVLNLPLSLFNALTTNLNKSCSPINIPLPYVNKNITLPCINTLYQQIGITSFLSWIGVIVSGLMLYTYLLKLYKWIEDRISLNETHNVDSWGGL